MDASSNSATPPTVVALVQRFAQNEEFYRGPSYNEALCRVDFISPMFAELGWDLANVAGYADAYRDVIHEDSLKIGAATSAPDYSFRIGGARKFFLEAKKPGVNLKTAPEPAFQLRRYAWSAKLPLSILTDFEEFAVYDCRVKPSHTDKPSVARILYLTYDQYPEKWGEIAAIFSKEAILKGSFDKYAQAARGKRGTAEVDSAFLAEIEEWRETLARNFALRNAALSVRDLNYAVQRTIDRIIFLRMCEDRGIERYGRLQELAQGTGLYARLGELFREADDKYNAGLFYFSQEPDRGPPDALTLGLSLDDKVLRDIVGRLYYPESPYEFSVLSADILGQVYEQFLGKVIRLTAGHRAVIEEKPEVRKAGGVYYTPTYIVDYIVKHTVGKLLAGRSPREVGPDRETKAGRAKKPPKGAKVLRVLDPACGSGSFLLGAYQYLLDWHRDQYVGQVVDGKPLPAGLGERIYQGAGGVWRLTIREKKRILLNNLYGVDIDPQAVEVTKLSLLLKVLEGETEETVGASLRLFHERALPDLARNIKCGNSLIGPDFYNGQQFEMFDEEERYRINAFDWQAEFPEAFRDGGFDAVIGNPPYLFITEVPEVLRSYYQARFAGVSYRFDLYGAFIECAALRWLRDGGVHGFIIPHTLLSNDSFRALRALLAEHTALMHIVDLGPRMFAGARNETMLLFFRRGRAPGNHSVDVMRTAARVFPAAEERFAALQSEWARRDGAAWLVRGTGVATTVLRKMNVARFTLGHMCTANQGLRTGNNEKLLARTRKGASWQPAVGGRHVTRYGPLEPAVYVDYRPTLLDAPRRPEIFTAPEKVVVQEVRNITLARRIVATLDTNQLYCLQSTNVVNARHDSPLRLRFVLGVLNSAAVNYYFRCSFPGNNHIPSNQLLRIPIPDPLDRAQHKRMISLVDRILVLHKRVRAAKTAHDRTVIQREIDRTDREIDRLVYELYGLTDEEIAVVEEAIAAPGDRGS